MHSHPWPCTAVLGHAQPCMHHNSTDPQTARIDKGPYRTDLICRASHACMVLVQYTSCNSHCRHPSPSHASLALPCATCHGHHAFLPCTTYTICHARHLARLSLAGALHYRGPELGDELGGHLGRKERSLGTVVSRSPTTQWSFVAVDCGIACACADAHVFDDHVCLFSSI